MIKLSNGLVADISNIRLDRLQKLPQLASGSVSYQMGSGCFLEPPGHPSYFMRSVGRDCNAYVIQVGDVAFVVDGELYTNGKLREVDWAKYGAPKTREERLNWLYSPLPIDHPRVRAWIQQLYQHQGNCYVPVEPVDRFKSDDIVIFPTQNFTSMGLFVAEPPWGTRSQLPFFFEHVSKESRNKLLALEVELVAEANATVAAKRAAFEAKQAKLCTPDRHLAVRSVRKFYPDYQPELDLITTRTSERIGDWWTILAEKPVPCPLAHEPHMRFTCQYCGDKSDGIPGPDGKVYNGSKKGDKEVYAGFSYHNQALIVPGLALR